MIKPSYTEGFWKISFEKFIELHKDLEFFKFATDQEKIAEYEKATGKTYKVETDLLKEPKKKGA